MKRIQNMIDKPVFLLPAILMSFVVVIGFAAPDLFSSAANAAFNFMLDKFSWFYALGTFLLLAFCFWAGFSKYGNIKLGGKDAEPEMSFFKWFAIAVTSGIAIGIVFYGIAEPITNFATPPGFLGIEGQSVEAAESAVPFTFFHWSLHTYGVYTSVGLSCAFIFWNAKRKFQVSSSLYPLIGDKADGIWGKIINGVAVFGIVGGIGTSMGIGVLQISSGINYVFGTNFSMTTLAILVIGTMAVIYIAAACTGLHKGVAIVSSLNMYVYIILMVWTVLFGGTMFILNNTVSSIGSYLKMVIPQSFYLEPVMQTGWVQNNSIFYWAWWISFAPIVGLFLIKLAKGRTIRQFVIVNLLAPSLFGFLWFGIFGSSAIRAELLAGGNAGIIKDIAEHGIPVAMFAFFKTLPLRPVLNILGFAATIFSFVTMAESMTLTIADMTCKADETPNVLKAFWGILMGLVAFIMLENGGLDALQTSVIVCALPLLVMILFMVAAYIKSMRHRSQYDQTLTEEECRQLSEEEKEQCN